MKIYIGTLIEKSADGQIFVQIHVSGTEYGLAVTIDDAIETEETERNIEIPRDFHDILVECTNGNQHNEPLSLGKEGFGEPEFLLSTLIAEV